MAAQSKAVVDLLWAYQLKREHQHLLARIQGIETASSNQNDRITAAEHTARNSRDGDMSALAKQVQELQDGDIRKRAERLEQKVLERLDDVQAEGEAMCLKVVAMEKGMVRREGDEKKNAFQREKSLLQRIGEVETGLERLTQDVEKLGEGGDNEEVEQLAVAIGQLKRALASQGREVTASQQGVSKVEMAQSDLRAKIADLMDEVAEIAAEVQRTAQIAAAPPESLAALMPPPLPMEENQLTQRPPRRSHQPKPVTSAASRPMNKRTAQQDVTAAPVTVNHLSGQSGAPKPARKVMRKASGWFEAGGQASQRLRPRAAQNQQDAEDDRQHLQKASAPAQERARTLGKRKATAITGEDSSEANAESARKNVAAKKQPANRQKRAVAALAELDVNSQPSETQRQTRSKAIPPSQRQHLKAPRATAPNAADNSDFSKWKPKGPRKPAATKAPSPVPSPGAAPETRAQGPRKDMSIQVANSQASTEVNSPSPKRQPTPQRRIGKRHIEQDGTDEEFLRKCREVLGE